MKDKAERFKDPDVSTESQAVVFHCMPLVSSMSLIRMCAFNSFPQL